MPLEAIVTAGLGFGDEGKGTSVEWLVEKTDSNLVVFYNGGAQRAHNVLAPDGRNFAFSQFGSGTFLGAHTLHAPGSMINPNNWFTEMIRLKDEFQIPVPEDWMHVHKDCLVTTPVHVLANKMRHIGQGFEAHGTCAQGIGETRFSAMHGIALHASDMLHPQRVGSVIARLVRFYEQELADLHIRFQNNVEFCELWDKMVDPELAFHFGDVCDEFVELVAIVDGFGKMLMEYGDTPIVFEGSQGVLLDESWGFQPHTTWSDTTFRSFPNNGMWDKITKLGITRTFHTRHGNGPFPTGGTLPYETAIDFLEHEKNTHNEYQGHFRIGYLDLVLMMYARDVVGGMDGVIVTHWDKVGEGTTVCTGYRDSEGEIFDEITKPEQPTEPWQMWITRRLQNATPQFEDVSDSELIELIEDVCGAPIMMLSEGPSASDKKETAQWHDLLVSS